MSQPETVTGDHQPSSKGHVFVVNGDVTRISCDAWLLPTDRRFHITEHWADHVGPLDSGGFVPNLEWNGRNVFRWEDGVGSPDIWLADVDSAALTANGFGDLLRSFVSEAAAHHHRTSTVQRRPRLALGLIGSGRGGLFANKGALVKELLTSAHHAAQDGVDVVLVAWGNKQYAALQRARMDLYTRGSVADMWDFGTDNERLERAAATLARQARTRQLVMFVGAGASASVGMPTWQKLLDQLGEQVGLKPEELQRFDVRDQAAIIKLRQTKESFSRSLNKQLQGSQYSLIHGLLASLPISEAVTTNFDTLLETAMRSAGRQLSVLPDEPIEPTGRWLLKLHGSLHSEDGVTLSRADYLHVATRYAALFALVQALLLTRHMLFVGYSLKDDDFHQLVFGVQQARGDLAVEFGTTLELFNQPLASELWSKKVHIIAMLDEPPDDSRTEVAADRLAVFLDLIAFHASDGRSFLMDDTYSSMLSDDEHSLKTQLLPLRAITDTADTILNDRVRQLLREFGAEPS